MNPELSILKLFIKDKNMLIKYKPVIESLILDSQIKIIYQAIEGYYNTIKHHEFISKEELIGYVNINYGAYKDLDNLITIINTVYDLDVSDSLCKQIVNNLIEKDCANKLLSKNLEILQENKFGTFEQSIEDILKLYNKFKFVKNESKSPFIDTDVEEMLTEIETNMEDGLCWRLSCLQDDIGSITGGVLGHIFARPDTGKTRFLASEVSNFVQQLKEGECIIWFNNEQEGKEVRLIFMSALCNASKESLLRNKHKAKGVYDQRNGNAMLLYDQGIILMEELVSIIREYKPRLVVIDQGDKIQFKGKQGMDLPIQLKELYRYYRELAKDFNIPIITVGQASAEAEGKKFLKADWMDYSKTGKYAEMDFIIGVGRSHEEGEEAIRYISVVKNKLKGINRNHTVRFHGEVARYEDLV